MARIAGVDLPRGKRIEVALTYIYGIGFTSSNEILEKAGVDPSTRVHDLSDADAAKIRAIIENHDMRLRPGMLMTVELLNRQRQALMIRVSGP